jgi:protein TonB
MLPVSAAVHAAIVIALVVAASVGGELPTAYAPLRAYLAAAPAPPAPALPSPSPRAVSSAAAAPVVAPDRIAEPSPAPESTHVSDAGLPDIGTGPIGAALPEGIGSGTPPPAPPVVTPPPPPTFVRPGGVIREPRNLVHPAPIYPDIARQARVEGLVILEATIDERGEVTGARVLRSVPLLDNAALSAVRQWRYTPTLLNGVPVRVLMTITFNFRLSDLAP